LLHNPGFIRIVEAVMKALVVVMVFLAISAGSARAAEAPSPTSVEARPLTHVRGGAVHGCGIRLTLGQPDRPASAWFDVSFNVFRRGIALVQSIAYEIRRSEFDGESRPALVPVQSTWVAAAATNARVGENSERRDALVYRVLADDALALFEAVATGRHVTLGIKRWGERVDSVYTAAAFLEADARQKIGACLGALAMD
jgi:hypothetical protein